MQHQSINNSLPFLLILISKINAAMKKIILFFLFFIITVNAQNERFSVISNLSFNGNSSSVQFNSLISKLNSDSTINSVYLLGNVTTTGTEQEFESLKLSLKKLNKPYTILPYKNDVRDFNGYSKYLEIFGDDKFVINGGNFVFIGINPSLPYSGIDHYTIENLNWLEETLDTFSLVKEIYFFSPIEIDKIGNWDAALSLLSKRNLKMIICGNAYKNELHSFNGINTVSLTSSYEKVNLELSYLTFHITRDSIIVSGDDKILFIVDKTLQSEITLPVAKAAQNISADIKTEIDLKSSVLTGAIYWENKIYITEESGIVSCYDTTGNLLWDYDTYGNLISSPIIADRILTLATIQGEVITLSAISGDQIQSIGFEENITTGLTVLEYTGSKLLMIPKLTKSNNAIVFGTASGKLICYDLETLQEYWVNASSNGMIKSKPVVIENKILFSSYDGFIYCIDARNGLLIWRWKEKAETDFSDASILTDGKRVYAVSNGNTIYAIDLLLGKLVWKNENLRSYPQLSFTKNQRSLLIKTTDNKIIKLNIISGKIEQDYRTKLDFSFSPSEILEYQEKVIFTNNGSIYSLDNSKAEKEIMLADNSPIINIDAVDENHFLITTLNGRVLLCSMR